MIIGLCGRKQSGKTTAANLIYSLYLSQLGISNKVYLSEYGEIIVEDLFGDTNYSGIFDINNADSSDVMIKRVFDTMNSVIKIYSFADPLKKDICMNILGLTYHQCYGTDEDKNTTTLLRWKDAPKPKNSSWDKYIESDDFMTARQVMEFVGTGIFREMKEDVWSKATLNKIKVDNPELAVICDCRFPNEVEEIKRAGGKVIRLTRNPFNSDVVSESILDKDKYDWNNFDYVIDNSEHSLYDQSVKIKTILEEILKL